MQQTKPHQQKHAGSSDPHTQSYDNHPRTTGPVEQIGRELNVLAASRGTEDPRPKLLMMYRREGASGIVLEEFLLSLMYVLGEGIVIQQTMLKTFALRLRHSFCEVRNQLAAKSTALSIAERFRHGFLLLVFERREVFSCFRRTQDSI